MFLKYECLPENAFAGRQASCTWPMDVIAAFPEVLAVFPQHHTMVIPIAGWPSFERLVRPTTVAARESAA